MVTTTPLGQQWQEHVSDFVLAAGGMVVVSGCCCCLCIIMFVDVIVVVDDDFVGVDFVGQRKVSRGNSDFVRVEDKTTTRKCGAPKPHFLFFSL